MEEPTKREVAPPGMMDLIVAAYDEANSELSRRDQFGRYAVLKFCGHEGLDTDGCHLNLLLVEYRALVELLESQDFPRDHVLYPLKVQLIERFENAIHVVEGGQG